MSEVQTNKISPATGTTFTLGDSGDTFNIPSGATIANAGTATGFGGDNSPAFSVYHASDLSLTNDTWTKATYDTELYDTDNAFASDKFTVPSGKNGKYYFTANMTLNANGEQNGIYMAVKLYKNGSEMANTSVENFLYNTTTGTFHIFRASVSGAITLVAGDYVEVYGRLKDSTGPNPALGTRWFQGYRLIGI
tara:strand:- start:258 stop:836 length:579 start_codon:yes stop_codon:yes gene_type:complete